MAISETTTNLTRSQLLVWLGQQQRPDVPLYNMVITFEIDGNLDVQLFQRAFREFVSDCDALRSVFEETAGQPHRRVVEQIDFDFEHIDFTHLGDPDLACNEWFTRRQARNFDLERCAFDAVLLQLAKDRFVWYLNQHHIITDGRSVSLIFAATANRYQALCTAADYQDDRPERPASFENYATYEHRLEQDGRIERARNYWQQRAVQWRALDQPCLFGRSQERVTTASDRLEIKLGTQRRDSLRALAASKNFSALTPEVGLFQILLTVFFAFLYRVTGERSLIIGAPSMNRSNARQRQTVGLLMQVFPLSLEIDPAETFASLHRKVRTESLNFLRYAAPGAAGPEISRAFNAVLNYTKVSSPRLHGAAVKQRFHHVGHGEPHHFLRLQVQDFEDTEDLLIEIDLNRGTFDEKPGPATIEYFIKTLDAILESPDVRLDEFELLPRTERLMLLETLQPDTRPYPRANTLHTMFEASARLHPDRLALVSDHTHLSYRELERRANRLAATLIRAGASYNDIVAIQLERSIDLVVAMLGVMKTGASYMPLADDIPSARRDHMLDLARVSLVVCSDALAGEIAAGGRRGVSVAVSDNHSSDPSAATPVSAATTDSTAYVLFTSGSTGEPKGVKCTHRGVVNLLEAVEELSALPDGAKCAWWCSATFDVSVYEIYSALAHARTLYIVPEQVRADGQRLFEWLYEQQIQSAYVPPFMLNEMRALLQKESATLFLERLLVGVEPIPEVTLAGIATALPNLQIINGYGPTEATICATLYVPSIKQSCDRNTPIGRPIRNTRVYLLDEARRLVPFGAVGEIYIGGDGLACGYLNRPALTDASFVTNPFDSSPDARLYKTGDLARFLPDGDLIYVSRADNQIKLRGQRIEPAEIERALLVHPLVNGALVVAEGGDNDKRLVAYLLLEAHQGLSSAQWHQWLETRLPRFMIPGTYVVLDTFPVTASGKIDRKALPTAVLSGGPRQTTSPPTTPLERRLGDIFIEVLELREIDIHAHFIELGGDSIRAMQIAAVACDAGITVAPRQIFEAGTIAALARVLQDVHQAPALYKSEVGNRLSAIEMQDILEEFGEDIDDSEDQDG